MRKITLLWDYKKRFGSKYGEMPYRSGMDKDLLAEEFRSHGFEPEFKAMSSRTVLTEASAVPVLYTSQEDPGYLYKDFIEDIVYGLELRGCKPIPSYKYLRANNNKVFMEILREVILPPKYAINSRFFGSSEEILDCLQDIVFPCVVKTAKGACSKGVFLANDETELLKSVRIAARSKQFLQELWDQGRSIKHKGYQKDSRFRSKFVVQDFISGLTNDWKVLVYYDKFYVLKRQNRKGDFRASGSGLFSFEDSVDYTLLDAAAEIVEACDVPMVSLDLAKKDNNVHLIEMQFLYFGTSTLTMSPYYYAKSVKGWEQIYKKSILEEEYVRSICNYLERKV